MSRRKRKSCGRRFAMLPEQVMVHQAAKSLSHAEFRVLLLLALQYRGRNNGHVGITKAQAAEHNVSSTSLYRALRTLEQRGLIELTYHASRTPPRPTMYALAWMPIDDTDFSTATRLPSHAYREWSPKPKPKAQRKRKPKLTVVKK